MYLHSEGYRQIRNVGFSLRSSRGKHYRKIGRKYDDGGPVVDLDGNFVGLFNTSSRGSFIPSSILLKCWDSWKKYGCVFPFAIQWAIFRPHLGLTFEAIKLLEPGHVDKIWRMYNIEDGLIVQEVSKGSRAQKLGIREGDIIESFNGECISTTVELENMLLSICKGPFGDLNAKVHISQTTPEERSVDCKCI